MSRTSIHIKLRKTISGTSSRPRLAVFRSLNNIFAQLIDDQNSRTLGSASSLKQSGSLMAKAELVGQSIAAKAKELKITAVVFDRGGFRYHGAVKAVAETARKEGLKL